VKTLTLAAALLVAAANSSSWAQSPADHEAHDHNTKGLSSTAQAPSAGQPGMMGQGMMGCPQGMMGMMGGNGMMGANMPMMNMMQMMGQPGGAGMSGMAMIDHVEGRIAFLRTELKITDAQSNAWSTFAEALRANAKILGEMHGSMMADMMAQHGETPQSSVDRLAAQEKWLTARLEGIRAIKSALTNLAVTFSDEQKKAADELLAPPMGMGAMGGAMQGAQMAACPMPGMMMQGR
jgi:LTXXQ motif family protein